MTAPPVPRRIRVPLLSPAAATVVFVVGRWFVGIGDGPETSAAGLGADGRVQSAWVVAPITSVDEARHRGRRLPATESELLELLRRDGAVFFRSDEVEVVHGSGRSGVGPGDELRDPVYEEFSLDEVEVIRATPGG